MGRYETCKKLKICMRCLGQDERTLAGHINCEKCKRKKALELKTRREAWEAMGLCKVCGGKKPKDRYLLCPACREKARGYKKERSEEYAEFLEWKKSRSQLAE